MKGIDISVSVTDFGGELFYNVTIRLPGELSREVACPDPPNCDAAKVGTRVKESSRRAKAKEIRKVLEGVEFPDA